MLWLKILLAKYGMIFLVGFMASFIFIINYSTRASFPIIPGDILIVEPEYTIYFPFGSSIAFGLGAVFMFEIYIHLRR